LGLNVSLADNTEKLAGLTMFLLVGLGIVQIVLGETVSRSVALTANGIDCLGDGFVSAVVWIGLRFFRRPADDKFHYGYYRIENVASVAAAFVMIALASYITLRSYNQLVDPKGIELPLLGAGVALVATAVAWGLGIYKYMESRGSNMSSVRLDAFNTIKDGTASFLTVVALVLSSYGYYTADAVVGFVIAGIIVTIGFAAIKESTYMLVDACDGICIERGMAIQMLAESMEGVESARVIRLRRTGPVFQGEVELKVSPGMSVRQLDEIRADILRVSGEQFPEIARLTVTGHPVVGDAEGDLGQS
jgi:cation diffusion facilitator family transporter